MSLEFIDYIEKANLFPIELSDKIEFYHDLSILSDSFTGLANDLNIPNMFLLESIQLITNGIVLFEKGYLDSAYYSLRQSIELSMTMVYLSELEENERNSTLQKWRQKSSFPMYSQMLNYLSERGNLFADIKEKMIGFFEGLKKIKQIMNKHVHKQGFDTFYFSRNHLFNKDKSREPIINEFKQCLQYCISAVAILRLCIDPLPLLLADQDIYERTEVFLTDPFPEAFIERYIGNEGLNAYKQTVIYKGAYDHFIQSEKKNPALLDISKNYFIDRNKKEEILSQIYLLNNTVFKAVIIALTSHKVTRIYDFLSMYSTETESNRSVMGINSKWKSNSTELLLNFQVEKSFVSAIQLGKDIWYIEHNDLFEIEEFECFQNQVRAKIEARSIDS